MADRPIPQGIALIMRLVNTRDVDRDQDTLATEDGLAAFDGELALGPGELPGLRRLREALRAAGLAHHVESAPPPAELTELFAAAPLVTRVDEDGAASLEPAPRLTGLAEFTARVAAVVAVAEARGEWRRLKVCEASDCIWAYYDHSPAGRRRWCSMRSCGSRAKMRAYRAKRRAGASGDAPAAPSGEE
ncbi:CGNR zinc finger domain-containing protein [Streptomyces profundus]|uniref:CGNR zinc finger domain-containing protein n=1 Tax=Streptomyces profundus TaxID=2867410 RepID=UPI001D1634C3|nr:CGNR zinc finger domain-containing protein [Streptomyces sp. MA3_2.13]UED85990.1 CGNR zinc finger domain-containing protein [Streptomyces sp. MA3_2.13]